ncbi:putative ATP-dependent RNA helicase TDRD12 [Polypterus senegalus]|uniref:putative ATP-dependent RNA helicase TDRD12 n=1 Tax=Polypterus senegalus TaxID=55291 RepID=UPI001962E897|nr:putative ATP-dependent RNA helicase TDRD12 [Polypterus senegalus]
MRSVVLLSLDCDKIPHLIDSLDFNPELPQKTLIFTNSSEEADHVFKVVRNSSLFSMKIHENLTHQIDFVKNQWKKVIGPGTHVILVLTNDFIKALDITDATCVVHFGFPVSPQLFGARQFCMKDYFQNLTEMAKMEQESNKAKSILLLTDKNASHIGGVLQYLERTEAVLPPTMKSFADGVWKAKEFQKRSKPLCKHLKTSGFCKNWQICPERHALFPTLDVPLYPQSNTVSILPLYIENASCYFGRIVQGMEDPYEVLSAAMSEYYKSNKDNPKTVEVGMLYGIQEETIFNRVQVLEVYEKEEGIFQQVTIKYIDDGRIKQVQAHNLLNLPSKFQSLHFQAVEIILYGVKPLDNETEWDSMVSTYINKKIRGKLHEADVVLCLGNTIWIDKMVLVTKIPDTKVLINEHVVQSEIIATGLGEKHPQHLNLLMSMFHEVGFIEHKETINNLKLLEASTHYTEENKINSTRTSLASENVSSERDNMIAAEVMFESALHTKCVHPKIKWYQTEDCLILNVKIMDPQEKNCEFFRNRVIFRAVCGDKVYLADLELHDDILKEKSTCVIKSSETVITLVKQTKTIWKQLLHSKNAFVTVDFDHIEDFEELSGIKGTAVQDIFTSTFLNEEHLYPNFC